jgi:hypothetical protein
MLAEEVERRTNKSVKEDGFASAALLDKIPNVVAQYIAKPIEPTENVQTLAWLSAETALALLDRGIES